MHDGHGGIPRFYDALAFLLPSALAAWSYAGSRSTGLAVVCLLLAAAFGWRLSFDIVMWDAMEYRGRFTPPEQLALARRLHAKMAPLLAIGAAGAMAGVLVLIRATRGS